MLTDRLVAVGLWERAGDDFLIHDFLLYQPSRAKVLEQRDIKAFAGRLGGKRAAKQRASMGEAEPKQTAVVVLPSSQANGQAESKPVPVPGSVPSASNEAERGSALALTWGHSPFPVEIPPLPTDASILLTGEVLEQAAANGCTDARKCLSHWHRTRWAKRGDRRYFRTDHLSDFMAWLCRHPEFGGACGSSRDAVGGTPPAGEMSKSIMAHIGGAR
jgi:hypothetical protein